MRLVLTKKVKSTTIRMTTARMALRRFRQLPQSYLKTRLFKRKRNRRYKRSQRRTINA